MLNAVDPKYKPWKEVREDLENIVSDGSGIKNSNAMCLTHGFHHQVTYKFKDPIRCVAYRSNSVREEFLVNHGTGPGNVFHLRKYTKTDQEFAIVPTKDRKSDVYATRFPVKGPPQQHIVYLPNYRLFVAFGSDKNLRVYADTVHRCKAVSAPTVCAMPVLSLVYIEDTDEVVTGGIGVIQPWKVRLSTNLRTSQSEEIPPRGRRGSVKIHGGISQAKHNEGYGPGRQMLQALTPYQCDLHSDDWVFHMRVCQGRASVSGGKQRLLVAVCHDAILAIDYMNRCQLWGVRLHDPMVWLVGGAGGRKPESFNEGDAKSSKRVANCSRTFHLSGHVTLTRCDFFPRFGYFVTGGGEGTIRIMHMVTFGLVHVLRGHISAITGLAAHPIYPMLISASSDGSIRIWCLETFTMTQRLDTGQKIDNLMLGNDPNFIYVQSKQEVTLYRLTKVYSLYTVLHSSAVKLTRVAGVSEMGIPGKILAYLEDGSVAVLCPLTGLLLTMIYPMTTFQIFLDMAFDPFYNLAYVRLHDGKVMQCNCSTNPSLPMRRYAPALPYDEDVMSVTSVILSANKDRKLSAIFAGLRNGQIALVHPNSLQMETMQAHSGSVKYMGVICKGLQNPMTQDEVTLTSSHNLLSVGSTTVRTWRVIVEPCTGKGLVEWRVRLEPELKVALPPCMTDLALVTALRDRLCVCTGDNMIFLLVLKTATYKTARVRRAAIINTSQANKELSRIKYGSSFFSNRASVTPIDEADSLKVHHHDDDHVARVTSLESSPDLNCFASCSVDGYVKIWDEDNKLIREICFTPHHLTAVCFPNGRDLLVALQGRVCLIDCCTFMTKQLIKERRIFDLDFSDDINEGAIPYDNDLSATKDVEDLASLPLEATERTSASDISPIPRIHVIKVSEPEVTEPEEKATRGKGRRLGRKGHVTTNESTSSLASSDTWRLKWVEIIEKVMVGIKAKKLDRKEQCKEDTPLPGSGDFKDDEKQKSIQEENSKEDLSEVAVAKVRQSYRRIVEYENCFEEKIVKRLLESKFPIAPDGYIQNSVIRKKVRPPTPKILTILEWKLRPAPEGEKRSVEEEEEEESLKSEESESRMLLLSSQSSDSFRFSSFSSIESIPDFSDLDVRRDEDADLEEHLRSVSSLGGDERGGTQAEEARKKVVYFEEVEKKRGSKPPADSSGRKEQTPTRYRSAASKDAPSRGLDKGGSSAPPQGGSEEGADGSKAPATASAQKKNVRDKLKEQRQRGLERAMEQKTMIPQLLKDITSAHWFRKKLPKVTPDSVIEALLEMGDTTRIYAHEKAIENIIMIAQEYPTTEGGGKENLSLEMMTLIQEHLVKYMKPSYDVTNPYANHPNRVALADNALDAIISGIPPGGERMQRELFRLLADDSGKLREKAKLILEVKLGIDSWEKLHEELSEMTGGDVVQDAEERVRDERTVMNAIKQNILKGRKSLVKAPRMAKRFGFDIVKSEESLPSRLGRGSSSSIFGGRSKGSLTSLRRSFTSRGSIRGVSSSKSVKTVTFAAGGSKERFDLDKFPVPVYDDTNDEDGGDMNLLHPEIPWRNMIPRKSLYRRKMSGLAAMLSKPHPAAPESRRKNEKKKSEEEKMKGITAASDKRYLPPISTQIVISSETEAVPQSRDTRDSRDTRYTRERTRDKHISREKPASRERRRTREARDTSGSRETTREKQESREGRRPRDSREKKDARDTSKSRDSREKREEKSDKRKSREDKPASRDKQSKQGKRDKSKSRKKLKSREKPKSREKRDNSKSRGSKKSKKSKKNREARDNKDSRDTPTPFDPSASKISKDSEDVLQKDERFRTLMTRQQETYAKTISQRRATLTETLRSNQPKPKPHYKITKASEKMEASETALKLPDIYKKSDQQLLSLSGSTVTLKSMLCVDTEDEKSISETSSNEFNQEKRLEESNLDISDENYESSRSLAGTGQESSQSVLDGAYGIQSQQSYNVQSDQSLLRLVNSLHQDSSSSLQRQSASRVINKLKLSDMKMRRSETSHFNQSLQSLRSLQSYQSSTDDGLWSGGNMTSSDDVNNSATSQLVDWRSRAHDSGFVEAQRDVTPSDADVRRDGAIRRDVTRSEARLSDVRTDGVKPGDGDWRYTLMKLRERRMKNDVKGLRTSQKLSCQQKVMTPNNSFLSSGERLVSGYSISKPLGEMTPDTPHMRHLAGSEFGYDNHWAEGESRYGIMNMHWVDGGEYGEAPSPTVTPRHKASHPGPHFNNNSSRSCGQLMTSQRDVSRARRLSSILNKARSKERETRRKTREALKSDEGKMKISKSKEGRTLLMLRIPSCESDRSGEAGWKRRNSALSVNAA